MAECFTCHTALTGAWNLTESPTYAKTGRYLGISNGYFMYSGNANWVWCYCLNCYKKEVMTLATRYYNEIGQQIPTQQQQLDQIKQQHQQTTNEVTTLQQQKTQLTTDTSSLQQQKMQLTTDTASLQQQKTQLTSDTSSLQQQKTTLSTDTTSLQQTMTSLQTQLNELKQQIEEILGTTGANQLRVVIEGLSDSEAQVLQIDRTSFSQRLKAQLKTSTTNFTKSMSEQLLIGIEHNKTALTKKIEDSEKAIEGTRTLISDAQFPDPVLKQVVETLNTHITTLKDQVTKWNAHKEKINALPPASGGG